MPRKSEEKGQKRGPSVVNVTKHLAGIDFPVNKQDLIENAKKKGLDESVMNMLNSMPDREYDSVTDVMKEYGKKYKKAA